MVSFPGGTWQSQAAQAHFSLPGKSSGSVSLPGAAPRATLLGLGGILVPRWVVLGLVPESPP